MLCGVDHIRMENANRFVDIYLIQTHCLRYSLLGDKYNLNLCLIEKKNTIKNKGVGIFLTLNITGIDAICDSNHIVTSSNEQLLNDHSNRTTKLSFNKLTQRNQAATLRYAQK